MTTNLHIQGTHCQSCKLLIEEVGSESPGVQSIKVDFETGNTIIEHDSAFDLKKFTTEVEGLGEYIVDPSQ